MNFLYGANNNDGEPTTTHAKINVYVDNRNGNNNDYGKTKFENRMSENWKTYKLGEIISIITDYHANGAYEKLKKM